jgi:hypothetical protein
VKNLQVVQKLILLAGFLSLGSGVWADDPFAGVSEKPVTVGGSGDSFFSENFGFRKEIMSEFGLDNLGDLASRQSVGFEVLKKFSSETSTFASVDFQGRFFRADGFMGLPNDMEGMGSGWNFNYYNAYADFYSVFGELGRFNFRIGHFSVPFGLSLQTDNHGTLLQLSNDRNFGFDQDWYAGFWGQLIGDINYDAYYLVGSGYNLVFAGQSGLGVVRFSLANRFSVETGLEGGLSLMAGQRLSTDALAQNFAVPSGNSINTTRVGLDGRYRQAVPSGLLTWTSELSGGADDSDTVLTQLHQLDYLHQSRQWGLSAQFRQFYQDFSKDQALNPDAVFNASDTSLLAEATWYFRNDVGNSNLQWVKLNVEWQLARQQGAPGVLTTLQYYQYW